MPKRGDDVLIKLFDEIAGVEAIPFRTGRSFFPQLVARLVGLRLLRPPRRKLKRRKPRFPKQKRSRWHVTNDAYRYRERSAPTGRSLYGFPDGKKPGPGIIAVVRKKYNSSGNLQSTESFQYTGTPSNSVALERCWDRTNLGPPFRGGGAFYHTKSVLPEAQVQGGGLYSTRGNPNFSGDARWEIQVKGFYPSSDWGPDLPNSYYHTSIPELVGYDTIAWDKLKPRISKATLFQTLVEMRDLPEMVRNLAQNFHDLYRQFIKREAPEGFTRLDVLLSPTRISEDWLSYAFGWVPFLNDLQKIGEVYRNMSQLINDVVVQNGKWVRKYRVLESTESNTLLRRQLSPGVSPGGDPIESICRDIVIGGISCKGYNDIRAITNTRVWAVGYFRYYRPEFDPNHVAWDSQWSNIQRLLTLYGVRINPSVIYKLTPWTWLVDWFTRAGDYIERLNDFIEDGIVSRNLHIMRQTERIVTKTCVIPFWSGELSMTWKRSFNTHQRKVADSPYGFDRPWQTLSMRQLSILGAIGITKKPNGFIARG